MKKNLFFLVVVMVFVCFFIGCEKIPIVPETGIVGTTVGTISYGSRHVNLNLPAERWLKGNQKYWRRGFDEKIPAWSFMDKKKKSSVTTMFFGKNLENEDFFLLQAEAELRMYYKAIPLKIISQSIDDFIESYKKKDLEEISVGGNKGFFLETKLSFVGNHPFTSQVSIFSGGGFLFFVHNLTGFADEAGHRKELLEKIIPNIEIN